MIADSNEWSVSTVDVYTKSLLYTPRRSSSVGDPVLRSCDVCGRQYEAKRMSSKMCGPTCRKRASRGAAPTTGTVIALGNASVEVGSMAGAVESTTRQVLAEVERVDTPLGQSALAMARRVDTGGDTGAGLAALIKQLEATLRSATSGSREDASPLDRARDELAARREMRGG